MNARNNVTRIFCIFMLLVGSVFASLIAPTAAAQNDTNPVAIRIAATVDAISIPQWIALKEGIFEKYGLKPVESIYNVNYQGLVAVGAGQNDASIQSGPATISYLAKGLNAVTIAVIGRFPAGYKLVAGKDIKSLNDLVGKKVAWAGGTGAEYALMAIAKHDDFDISSVEHIDLPPAEAVPLLLKGTLSAVFYWEPWPRRAVESGRGNLHVVATSKGIYESNMFLTVSRSFANQHPEAVKNLLRVFREAEGILEQHPEKGISVLRERMRVDEQTAKDSMEDYAYMVKLDQQTVSTVKSVADWLKQTGKIEQTPDWESIFSSEYLKSVDPDSVSDFPW